MSDPSDTAKRCFEENLQLFASARTEPEKFNLYNGLARLADAIGKIESELSDIRQRLRKLERA